jgi:hypothetical protein
MHGHVLFEFWLCVAGLAAEPYAPRRQPIISIQVRRLVCCKPSLYAYAWTYILGFVLCLCAEPSPPADHINTDEKQQASQYAQFLQKS